MPVGATREYVASLSEVHPIRQHVIMSYMSYDNSNTLKACM